MIRIDLHLQLRSIDLLVWSVIIDDSSRVFLLL